MMRATNLRNIEKVWSPIPHSSQYHAIVSPCNITLYTGSRGPGKSDTQLMAYRRRVGQGYGPFWRGVIFDRHYKNLDDLVSKSKRWFPKFEDGCQFKESKADYKWVWPTGEELLFRSAETVADYYDFHGQEFPFIGWNELTNYQTLDLFDMMMSCNRSSYVPEVNGYIGPGHNGGPPLDDGDNVGIVGPLVSPFTGELPPPIPLSCFVTTNPFGVGHHAVKTRFIDPAPYGKIVETITRVYDPKQKEDVNVRRTQVAIFGSYRENIYLDPQYIAVLNNITDPNMRRAWLFGDWDIIAGGPLDDVWDRNLHILPRFKVPASWRLDRAYDWGSAEPASYGLFAEANGEEAIMPDGSIFCPPAGTIIQISELYMAEALGTNKGLRWSSTTQAQTMLAHEQGLRAAGWISGPINAGPADNSIENVTDSGNATIKQLFQKEGISFTRSDKAKGARIVGLELMRQRLDNAKRREGPALYFTRNCIASFTTIPAVPRDDKNINDVNTKSEDHAYDMVRYRCLSAGRDYISTLPVKFPT